MYRNIIKTTIAIISSFALLFTSCDLDKSPYEDIPLAGAWESIDDAIHFRYGTYATFRNVQGGKYAYAADVQSDLFNETIESGNRAGEMHSWTFNSSADWTSDYWKNYYQVIRECNNILQNIDKIPTNSTDEVNTISKIRGEAYLMRAISNHALVVRFAKDYEPVTATTDLGLPIVKTYDTSAKPARSSLQETYDFIKEDIDNARTYLTATTQEKNDYGFLTVDAIDIFEARVNMYMHDYNNAITLTDKIINKFPLLSTSNELKEMWVNDKSSEIIFQPKQTLDERTNSMAEYYTFNTGNNAFNPGYVPSKWIVELYDNNDYRKSIYFDNPLVICGTETVTDVYLLSKFPGNPDLQRDKTERYNMFKTFRAAEAYLIAAESSFRNSQETPALKYINDLRTKRNAPLITGVSGNSLFEEIKKEWIREFIGEGQRLNDLKRWHEGFTRHDPQNTSILLVASGNPSLAIDASNQKFVWEISSNDLSSNVNLVPNWTY